MTRLLLSLIAAGSMARADFDAAHWQFRRRLAIANPAPIVSLRVDAPLYRGSRAQLRDLRILRDGVEVPYLIRILSGSEEQRERRPALLNKSAVPGTGLQATLDLGARVVHNRLRIATSQKNFKQRVRIETSDDDRNWAVAREDGYIFDFSQGDRRVSVLTVDYPAATRRFVRLTIFGWSNPDYLDSAWLTYSRSTPGTLDLLATVTPSAADDSKAQTTVLTADIGFSGLPHDRVELEIAPGLFYRTGEVESASDAKNWVFVGQGVVSRTADRESLWLTFPEQWDRYLRLRIFNHDNPPLAAARLRLYTYRRVIEFPAETAGQYRLYYGNADAKQPAYDFAQTMPAQAKAVEATAGDDEPNPAYQPPKPPQKPWSDRHPQVLYGVLLAAIVVMGFLAIRFLLKVQR